VRRLLFPLSIAGLGILLSVLIFTILWRLEDRTAQASFYGVAEERLDALETNVSLALNNLVSTGALFDHAPDVTREQFNLFTSPLLARTQAVQAMEWIPRVPQQQRGAWEEQARRDGYPGFEFTQRDSAGRLARAKERDEYFPVYYVAPFHSNEKALGFDLASDPVRRAALWRSADSAQPAATGRVVLVQETSNCYGFLVFRPVYRRAVVPEREEDRRKNLVGFALAVFRVADIVEKPGAISNSVSGLSLAIFDRDAARGDRLLYPKGLPLDDVADLPQGFRAERTFSVGGRVWEAVVYPLPGSFRPVHWSSWAVLAGGGLLTFLLTSYVIQRKRAEQRLRQSEERARSLFLTIPHPTFVLDSATLAFLEVNQAAVHKYGYSIEEFRTMKFTALSPPEEVERFVSSLQQPPSMSASRQQWTHMTRAGQRLDVEIHFNDLRYGGCDARVAIAQDVTEQNRLEINLRQGQKLEAVGALAAGIAHEINTPIQFLGDNTQFLANSFESLKSLLEEYRRLRDRVCANGPSALTGEIAEMENAIDIAFLLEEVPRALDQSLEGIERVATLVRAMKEFAHPDLNESAAADINKALLSTITVARNELKHVADVETEFSDLPLVTCNIGQLNQVFLNLLINAAHAIGEKKEGSKGLIRVATSLESNWVSISISDTGCGIAENVRDRIFDPFFTTKEVGRGTGQGLAIARSVVARHGGSITFTSTVGRGTTFCVRVPVADLSRRGRAF